MPPKTSKSVQNRTEFQPKPLSIEQRNAIDLLITGATDAEVAAAVGVNREAVNRWQREVPLFMAELEIARQAFMGKAVDSLRSALPKAVSNLVAAVEGGDLKASIELLKVVGLHGDHTRFATGETDAQAITTKLALEQLSKEGVPKSRDIDRLINTFDNNPAYDRRKAEIMAELGGDGNEGDEITS